VWLEARAFRPRRTLALLAGAALGLPLLAFPTPVLRAIAAVVGRLFPTT
jgi:hypothetical protein